MLRQSPHLDKIIAPAMQLKSDANKLIQKNTTVIPDSKALLEKIAKAKFYDDLLTAVSGIGDKKINKSSAEFKRFVSTKDEFLKLPEQLAELEKAATEAKQVKEELAKAQTQISEASEQAKKLAQVEEKLRVADAKYLAAQQEIQLLKLEEAKQARARVELEAHVSDLEKSLKEKTVQHASVTATLTDLVNTKEREHERHLNEMKEKDQRLESLQRQLDSAKRLADTLEEENKRTRASSAAASSSATYSVSSDALVGTPGGVIVEPRTPAYRTKVIVSSSAIAATPAMPKPAGTVAREGARTEIKADSAKAFTEIFTATCRTALAHMADIISSRESTEDVKKNLEKFRFEFLKRYADKSIPHTTDSIIEHLLTKDEFRISKSFFKETFGHDDKEERQKLLSSSEMIQESIYQLISEAYKKGLTGNLSAGYADRFNQLAQKSKTEEKNAAQQTSKQPVPVPPPTATMTATSVPYSAQRPSVAAQGLLKMTRYAPLVPATAAKTDTRRPV